MPTPLIVITGSSGVGKTTLARALQDQLLPEQWLHFSVDTLFYGLPRAIVQQVDQHNDHSQLDARQLVGSAHACVHTLLDRGHRVIFDAVVLSDTGARKLLAALGHWSPLLVSLHCGWDEVKRRTLARGDRTLAEAEHGHRLAADHLQAHHRFDTTRTSAEQFARQLAAVIQPGAPVG